VKNTNHKTRRVSTRIASIRRLGEDDNIVATDVENDGITYSLGRRPVGMTISDEGKVEWKPTSGQI
jgi:hypothetical protein